MTRKKKDAEIDLGGPSLEGSKWYVYLLTTGTHTYVGSTTDPHRRLRQHNGELTGGARSTSRHAGKWRIVGYLAGFQDRSSACRWEKLIKSRARGIRPRWAAMLLVSHNMCPQQGTRPMYPVPAGLKLVMEMEVLDARLG